MTSANGHAAVHMWHDRAAGTGAEVSGAISRMLAADMMQPLPPDLLTLLNDSSEVPLAAQLFIDNGVIHALVDRIVHRLAKAIAVVAYATSADSTSSAGSSSSKHAAFPEEDMLRKFLYFSTPPNAAMYILHRAMSLAPTSCCSLLSVALSSCFTRQPTHCFDSTLPTASLQPANFIRAPSLFPITRGFAIMIWLRHCGEVIHQEGVDDVGCELFSLMDQNGAGYAVTIASDGRIIVHSKDRRRGKTSAAFSSEVGRDAWTVVCISVDAKTSSSVEVQLSVDAGNRELRSIKRTEIQFDKAELSIGKNFVGQIGDVVFLGGILSRDDEKALTQPNYELVPGIAATKIATFVQLHALQQVSKRQAAVPMFSFTASAATLDSAVACCCWRDGLMSVPCYAQLGDGIRTVHCNSFSAALDSLGGYRMLWCWIRSYMSAHSKAEVHDSARTLSSVIAVILQLQSATFTRSSHVPTRSPDSSLPIIRHVDALAAILRLLPCEVITAELLDALIISTSLLSTVLEMQHSQSHVVDVLVGSSELWAHCPSSSISSLFDVFYSALQAHQTNIVRPLRKNKRYSGFICSILSWAVLEGIQDTSSNESSSEHNIISFSDRQAWLPKFVQCLQFLLFDEYLPPSDKELQALLGAMLISQDTQTVLLLLHIVYLSAQTLARKEVTRSRELPSSKQTPNVTPAAPATSFSQSRSPLQPVATLFHGEVAQGNQQDRRASGTPNQVSDTEALLMANPPIVLSAARSFLTRFVECDGQSVLALLMGRCPTIRCAALKTFCAVLACINRAGFVAGTSLGTMKEISVLVADRLHRCKCSVDEIVAAFEMLHCDVPAWFECSKSNPFASPVRPVVFYSAFNVLFAALRNADPGTRLIAHMRLAALASTEGSAEKLISGFPEWQQVFCEDLCVMSHNLLLPDAHEDDINALDCALSFLSRVAGDVCFHSASSSGTSSIALLLHTLSECRATKLLPMFLLKVFGEINSRLSGLNHSECTKFSNLWNIITHLGMWSVLVTSGTGSVKLDQESSTARSGDPVSSFDAHPLRSHLSRSLDSLSRTYSAPDILEAFLKATDTLLRFAATNITAWELFTADVSALGESVVTSSPSKSGGFFPVRGLVSSVVGAVGSVMELIAYAAGESQYPPMSLWSLVLGSTLQCILYRAEKVVVTTANQDLPQEASPRRAPDSLASFNRVLREHIERTKTVLSLACQPKDMSWFGYAKATALKSSPRLLFSAITVMAASLNLLPFGPLGSLKAETTSGTSSETSESDGFLILGFHDRLWPAVQDVLIRIGLVDQFAAFIHAHSSTVLSYPELSPLRSMIAAASTLTSDSNASNSSGHSLMSDFLVALHGVAWVPLLHSSSVLSQAFRGVEKCQFGCSTSVSRWVMYQRPISTKQALNPLMPYGGPGILALESTAARICHTLMLRLARHRQSRLSDSDLTFHSGMAMLSDWEDEFASEVVPLPMSMSCDLNFNDERRQHQAHGACTARFCQDKPFSHIKVDAHEHALSRMRMRMRYCKKPLVARPAESIDQDALACASDSDGRVFDGRLKVPTSTVDPFPLSIISTRCDSSEKSPSTKTSFVDSAWDFRTLDGGDDLSSSMMRSPEKGDDAMEFDASTTELDAETEIVGRSVVTGSIHFNAQRVRAAVESGMRFLNLRLEGGSLQPRDRSSSDVDAVIVQSDLPVVHPVNNSGRSLKPSSHVQVSSSATHHAQDSVEVSAASVAGPSPLSPSVKPAAAARSSSQDILVAPPIQSNDLKLALDCEYVRPMQAVRGIFSIAQNSVCFYVPNVATPGCDIDSVPDSEALWTIISDKSVKGYSHVRRVMQLHHPGVHPCTCHILFCVSTLKIKKILRRRFLLQPTAMELLRSNRYYMFSFRHSSVSGPLASTDLRSVKSAVARLELAIEALVPLISSDSSRRDFRVYKNGAHAFASGVASYTDLWTKRAISNFDYLMYLNTIAGRTYNDLTQYPVFPWVLQDYTSSQINLGDKKSFRDLSKPIGAQDPVREAKVQDRYSEFEDNEGTPKFHYGSHYSSLGSVLFFLIRMRPFTDYALDLQGGHFDHADRIFTSIQRTYTNITTSMTDVKELLPEFYYNPHFLDNHNELTLGQRQNGTLVGEVDLPPWANGSSQVFVEVMRAALESEYVSANLHHWIDLVFGYKQQGSAAVEATNVFFYLTYEGSVDLDAIDPAALVAIETQIANFGQTPAQLLTTPHRPRQVYINPFSSMRVYSPRLPSALSDCIVPFSSPPLFPALSSQSAGCPPGRRLLSFSADDTVKLLYRYDAPSSAVPQIGSNTSISGINMSNITEVSKAIKSRRFGDGGGDIVTIMPNERCSTIYALTSGGSLIELKVLSGDRQWRSPSSQICKKLDWPLHRVLAHGSTLFKSASAMVGEHLVSVCGWEGGATMRSVPVTGGRSNSKTVFHHSMGCCCVSASPDGNWMVTGGFDGTVTIYKSTNRFEDFEWMPYFGNRSHAAMITHCSVWPSHSVVMTGCDNGVLILRDLSRQLLLLSFDFGPDFSVISAHLVGHSIVVLSGPCLNAGLSSIGITSCAKIEKPRICKLSMISFSGVLLHEVVVDPSACALAFCPDPSYLEPPGLLFLALGSVIDVYSAFNLGRLSTLRLSSEDQPTEITALQSVQQKLLVGDSSGSVFVLDVSS